MRVLVMGAGGVGGYYGALLARSGHEVTFVARGAHLESMRTRGLDIRDRDATFLLRPVRAVATPAETDGRCDLVLFTVKTYDTEQAAAALQPGLGPETAVLTLQNGVDSVDQLNASLGPERVLAGTTRIEALIVEPGLVERRSPFRDIWLGEQSGEVTPRVEAVAAALREAGADVFVTEPTRVIWDKFIRLAPNASLTSACRATIGQLYAVPEGEALYRQLVREVVAVGRASGVEFPGDVEATVMAQVQAMPVNMTTSMQRDFEAGRPVEVEHLTGAIVRRGRALGVPTPGFEVVYAILKLRAAARR